MKCDFERDWAKLPLWNHQKNAVELILDYYNCFHKINSPTSKYDKGALVRMPTGTGKSGIIAVISRCFPHFDRVLIVTPWSALRDQIKRDVSQRFWGKIKVDVPNKGKEIYDLFPSTVEEILGKAQEKPCVVTTTVQALQTIYRDQPITYFTLHNLFKLVIVDEGHREPAPEWSKAIRDLGIPTVLFTATPYRNDHKMFNVDDKFTFILSHNEAEENKFIREIRFIENRFSTRGEFIDSLLNFFYGPFQQLRPSAIDKPKVIIRCETSDDIIDIAYRLKSRGETVVAVHERFSDNDDDQLAQKVPNPEEHSETFWIHQHKLVEGIDDPNFCLLALYSPFRNARALVQQVGRVIRNPTRSEDQTAYIYCHPAHRQQGYWKGYRKYEEIYNQNPDKFEPRVLFDNIIELQPIYQIGYIGKEFRERFDFEANPGELHLHLAYPRSCNVYQCEDVTDFDQLSSMLQKEWNTLDLDIRKAERPDNDTLVLIYQVCQNSPVLIHHALLEFRIGYTILRKKGKYLFYFDSEGNSSLFLAEKYYKVSSIKLENLFKGRNSRISQISLLNTDLGHHSVRRRIINAYSVEDTAPNLVDYAHFYSTAHGYTTRADNNYVRRYVGFTRSRITDPSATRIEYAEYLKWLDFIAIELDKEDGQEIPLFNRFARQINPPTHPEPLNILFDLDEVSDSFVKIEEDEEEFEPFSMDDKCYDITGGEFGCLINGEEYKVSISYDRERHRYHLRSSDIEKSYTKIDPVTNEKEEGLLAYINRTQSFRVVTNGGIIYAHNHFYEPKLTLWGKRSGNFFDLSKIIYPNTCLSAINSEKGSVCKTDNSGWEDGSLFDFIDKVGEKGQLAEGEEFDFLVCDDMGKETADFIAVSIKNKRVVLIHAKAHDKPAYTSASAFHEICSQATKNLGFISPFSKVIPGNKSLWDGVWRGPSTDGFVSDRIRRSSLDSDGVWRGIESLLNDPSSKKEVWLVIGQGFSYQRFTAGIKKKPPQPEIIQILFLLQSTWSATASIGASLRIYCSE
jgi:superfamily II DNA or RNA helicase